MKKPKQEAFTSNHSNAKIEMYDRSAKRSEHHGGADHDPAHHHNWSAPIAVDENAADGSCTGEREKLTLYWSLVSLKRHSSEATFTTDLLRTSTRAWPRTPRQFDCRRWKNIPESPCRRWWGTWERHRRILWRWTSRRRQPSPSLHPAECSLDWTCSFSLARRWETGKRSEQCQTAFSWNGNDLITAILTHSLANSRELTSAKSLNVCYPGYALCRCDGLEPRPTEKYRSQAFDLIMCACTINVHTHIHTQNNKPAIDLQRYTASTA